MSIPQLLHTMCAELPDADLNAIRKARGFSASETASRSSFANFFVTTIGLETVMSAISPEEAICLRLLHETGEVDVTFFERVYGAEGGKHSTFTQRYKSTFDSVKKSLVRRGLVVMAEIKTRSESVQLERWRYALPPEFAAHLPALPAIRNEQPGAVNDLTLRRKLLELVGGAPAIPNDTQPFNLNHGSLYLGKIPFSGASFSLWQSTAWMLALKTYKPNVVGSLEASDAMLKLLSYEDWTKPADMDAALKIACFGGPTQAASKKAQQGWELGLLARLNVNSLAHYRIAPARSQDGLNKQYPANLAWADTQAKAGSIKIDLRLIPLHDLDMLNTLTHLALENNELFASPSLVKLGRAIPAQRNSPLSRWLTEQAPAFGRALEAVNAKWGKTLLHEKLLVARVNDLSLRVQIERELKDNVVVLSEHFIAFPLEARANVDKVLKKAGFVTRTVKA